MLLHNFHKIGTETSHQRRLTNKQERKTLFSNIQKFHLKLFQKK